MKPLRGAKSEERRAKGGGSLLAPRSSLFCFLVCVLSATRLPAVRLEGTVNYQNFTLNADGFNGEIFQPARFIDVEIVDIDQMNAVIATTRTGEDGRFVVDVAGVLGKRLGVEVYARSDAALVIDPAGRIYKWATVLSPQVVNSDPFVFGTLNIQKDDDAGALNIVDVVTVAYSYLQVRSAQPIPRVLVVWKRNVVPRCGTCYDGQLIFLLNQGVSSSHDTDEYDDSVILHEYAHHVQHNLSCIGNGGPHGQCEQDQDPTVSWAEGMANYFSVLTGSLDLHADQVGTFYLDTHGNLAAGSGILVRDDVERNDGCGSATYGPSNEESVSRVLWDLQDDIADPPDAYQRSERDLFELIASMQSENFCGVTTFMARFCSRFGQDGDRVRSIFAHFNLNLPATCTRTPRRRTVRR